uniref:Uncharacterized protein n=1 Tax=Geladintestivirus 5 TaxID=3233137 RepID=A0AAU8MKG1_9CAUD
MAEISTGLMKKTKAQLVEIILRKDEVERECRTEISNLNKRIKGYTADIKGMSKQSKINKSIINKQANMLIEKENLIEDMKSQFDLSATEVAEAKEIIYMYKCYLKTLSIICAILIITLICKLFVF